MRGKEAPKPLSIASSGCKMEPDSSLKKKALGLNVLRGTINYLIPFVLLGDVSPGPTSVYTELYFSPCLIDQDCEERAESRPLPR